MERKHKGSNFTGTHWVKSLLSQTKIVWLISFHFWQREYNPKIGEYKSTIVNQGLNYVARFSNGKLEIPQEMYEVYKASRVTEDELEFLARHLENMKSPF